VTEARGHVVRGDWAEGAGGKEIIAHLQLLLMRNVSTLERNKGIVQLKSHIHD